MFARISTVAGERGAADAERDIRGTALKFYTEDGNWDIVGNNTPVFFFRDPLRSPTSTMRSSVIRGQVCAARTTTGISGPLPEALHQVTIVMSDRGIPKSFRHMHLFGSHTFSMINAANERVWSSSTSDPSKGSRTLPTPRPTPLLPGIAKVMAATCLAPSRPATSRAGRYSFR